MQAQVSSYVEEHAHFLWLRVKVRRTLLSGINPVSNTSVKKQINRGVTGFMRRQRHIVTV